jgi:hypothetical protein
VGGVQVQPADIIIDAGRKQITVNIPEGAPGASPIFVSEAPTDNTIIYDWEHSATSERLPSMVVSKMVFWRTSPKPIFVNARTGSRLETQANVKMMAWDGCNNPFTWEGGTATIEAYNPDDSFSGASSSTAVVTGAVNDLTGVAAVGGNTSGVARAAVVVGFVRTASSDDLYSLEGREGNVTVTAVPHAKSDPDWSGTGITDDGKNAVVLRAGDEAPSDDSTQANPMMGLTKLDLWGYTAPDGSDPTECFETERNISVNSMTGSGTIYNLGVSGPVLAAGTGLTVFSGSPMADPTGAIGNTGTIGVLGMAGLNAEMEPATQPAMCMALTGLTLGATLDQSGSSQTFASFDSTPTVILDSFRNVVLQLVFSRASVSVTDPCPAY